MNNKYTPQELGDRWIGKRQKRLLVWMSKKQFPVGIEGIWKFMFQGKESRYTLSYALPCLHALIERGYVDQVVRRNMWLDAFKITLKGRKLVDAHTNCD